MSLFDFLVSQSLACLHFAYSLLLGSMAKRDCNSDTSAKQLRICPALTLCCIVGQVDAEFFDWYMEAVPDKVQLILCGDFHQLPPVPDKQGSLNDDEHLKSCVFAARRKDWKETRDVGGSRDPAVEDDGWLDMSKNTPFGMKETTGKYAFQSAAWGKANLTILHLTVVHRTKEAALLAALTDLRAGLATSVHITELVRQTSRALPTQNGVEPTTLYPKKKNVERMNEAHLQKLDKATVQVYTANDAVELHESAPRWLTKQQLLNDSFFRTDCQAGQSFELRLGAQVMLLRNEQASQDAMRSPSASRLVNGSRGVVIAFDYACPLRSDDKPVPRFDDKAGSGVRLDDGGWPPSPPPPSSFPSLGALPECSKDAVQPTCGCGNPAAWACIRRRCGVCCSTSGCARHSGRTGGGGGGGGSRERREEVGREADPRAGDDYVSDPPAMPRDAAPASALPPAQWEQRGGTWHNRVTGEETGTRPAPQLYPVVRFVGSHGKPGRVKLVRPEAFDKAVYLKGTLTRSQVPLALAWALTIHKGQGASLDYMCADLEGSFADGGSYVAISRACTISGLEIRNYAPSAVKSSVLVRDFYAAVDAGRHAAFLEQPGMWWGCPILDHPRRRWASLYRRNKVFAGWADEVPHSASTAGSPVKPEQQQPWQQQPWRQQQQQHRHRAGSRAAAAQSPSQQQQQHTQWRGPQYSDSPSPQQQQQPQSSPRTPPQPTSHQRPGQLTPQWPPAQRTPQSQASTQSLSAEASPQSQPALTLCKCNCNRPISPGLYRGFRGLRPYDTCCRPCATYRVANGQGHDPACEQRYRDLQSLEGPCTGREGDCVATLKSIQVK